MIAQIYSKQQHSVFILITIWWAARCENWKHRVSLGEDSQIKTPNVFQADHARSVKTSINKVSSLRLISSLVGFLHSFLRYKDPLRIAEGQNVYDGKNEWNSSQSQSFAHGSWSTEKHFEKREILGTVCCRSLYGLSALRVLIIFDEGQTFNFFNFSLFPIKAIKALAESTSLIRTFSQLFSLLESCLKW